MAESGPYMKEAGLSRKQITEEKIIVMLRHPGLDLTLELSPRLSRGELKKPLTSKELKR